MTSVIQTSSHFVSSPRGDQRIHVHVTGAGDAPPVLLLHSGGFTTRQWRRLTELLAPSYRVIAPDLLGYAESTRIADKEPFHFRQDLALLEILLAEIGTPAHLVGHSYGGLLALKLALAQPSRVRSMALYEPVAFGVLGENLEADVNRELGRISLAPNGEGTVDDAWLSMFVDWWNGVGAWKAMAAETKAAFRSVGWKVFQEVCSLVDDHTPLATYATIEAPTLLLGGDQSPAVEQNVLARLAGAMPHARHDVLAGVGHMGPITHGAQVNKAIADFIAARD